jgi:hypothetical protein
MVTRERADELRGACEEVALRLGGWTAKGAAPKPPSRKNRATSARNRRKASRTDT